MKNSAKHSTLDTILSQPILPNQPKAGFRSITLNFLERKALLLLVDLLVVNVALVTALEQWPNTELKPTFFPNHLEWVLSLSLLWLILAFIFNLYDLLNVTNSVRFSLTGAGVAIFTCLLYLFIPFLTPSLPNHRLPAFLFVLMAGLGIGTWRVGYLWLINKPSFEQRALIVGTGQFNDELAQIISQLNEKGTGYRVVGVTSNLGKHQAIYLAGLPVVGANESLGEIAQDLAVTELIITGTDNFSIEAGLYQQILSCQEAGVQVTSLAVVYEKLTGRVPLLYANNQLQVALPLTHRATLNFYRALRRLLDIAVGFAGCLLLIMVIPFVWLANHLTSPGPLFYRQERVGQSGKLFSILKFRSMIVNAEKGTGAVWASSKDPRITPFGQFLRKTRLDEIPQFWNILTGEMSLIGPRPERPFFVNQFTEQLPLYRVRHYCKPGLTGWAQVMYRYTDSFQDSMVKVQYDLYYLKNYSLWLDIQIVLKTIGVVLGFKGR